MKSGRYNASIRTDGKTNNIGSFDTAIAAALAYDQAAIKAGRKSHTLNFPDDPLRQSLLKIHLPKLGMDQNGNITIA